MTTTPIDKPMALAKTRLSHNAVFWIGFCVVMALLIVAPLVALTFGVTGFQGWRRHRAASVVDPHR